MGSWHAAEPAEAAELRPACRKSGGARSSRPCAVGRSVCATAEPVTQEVDVAQGLRCPLLSCPSRSVFPPQWATICSGFNFFTATRAVFQYRYILPHHSPRWSSPSRGPTQHPKPWRHWRSWALLPPPRRPPRQPPLRPPPALAVPLSPLPPTGRLTHPAAAAYTTRRQVRSGDVEYAWGA